MAVSKTHNTQHPTHNTQHTTHHSPHRHHQLSPLSRTAQKHSTKFAQTPPQCGPPPHTHTHRKHVSTMLANHTPRCKGRRQGPALSLTLEQSIAHSFIGCGARCFKL